MARLTLEELKTKAAQQRRMNKDLYDWLLLPRLEAIMDRLDGRKPRNSPTGEQA